MYCGLVPSIVEWSSLTFSLSFYWRSIHAPRHNLDLSSTLIDFEISLEYYCIELLKSEVELREGLQKTIDYFKARTCHREFQHRCPYVDNVLQCPRVLETAYLKLELPGLHFWSIWKSWGEMSNIQGFVCFIYLFNSFYIFLLSLLFGNSCKLLCKSSAWCFRLWTSGSSASRLATMLTTAPNKRTGAQGQGSAMHFLNAQETQILRPMLSSIGSGTFVRNF